MTLKETLYTIASPVLFLGLLFLALWRPGILDQVEWMHREISGEAP